MLAARAARSHRDSKPIMHPAPPPGGSARRSRCALAGIANNYASRTAIRWQCSPLALRARRDSRPITCIPLSRTALRWQCASLALCARRDDPYLYASAFSCCTTHTRTAPGWRCSPLALRVYTDKILTTDCAHVPAPAHDMHARTAISIRWQCSPLALRARRDSDPTQSFMRTLALYGSGSRRA